jgi:hypothetical protein
MGCFRVTHQNFLHLQTMEHDVFLVSHTRQSPQFPARQWGSVHVHLRTTVHVTIILTLDRSLVITSLGIILETAAFTFGLFEAINGTIGTIVFGIGWPFMVTGFSFVLYSRLHLVVQSSNLLRCLLAIIVMDAILIQFPLFILSFIGAPQYVAFLKVARFLSHFEIIFSVQEVIFSSLYIIFFLRFVNQGGSHGSKSLKRTLQLLITAELIIIVCDITVNILLYLNLYIPRKIILPFVYAIKLQIEFLVLNRLVGSRQNMDTRLHDDGADWGIKNTLPDISQSHTRLGICSRCSSSPPGSLEKNMESFGPMLTITTSCKGTKVRETKRDDQDSIEELERRYLGRFVVDGAV